MTDGLRSPRRSRVLVADDVDRVKSLLVRLLSADGHEVISASDGQAAFAVQRTSRMEEL
jgi:CheY-like chemotaxis protein